jgi:hypothetical protein
MPRSLTFFLIVAGFLAVCVAAATFFNTMAPIFVWFVATLAFEFWWRARMPGEPLPFPTQDAGAAGDNAERPVFPLAQPWIARLAVGIAGAALVAFAFAWMARDKVDFALVGMPYWIPLGAAVIGNIAPRGLDLAAFLFGGGKPALRSVLALSMLAMLLLFVFQYLNSGLSYADFIEAYFMPTTGYFPRSEFANVAPIPAATPALMLAGYLAGAAIYGMPGPRK